MFGSAYAFIQFGEVDTYTNITISFWHDHHTGVPAHHAVGASTLVMTPKSSILVSSAFTLGHSGRATLLGVHKANGLAFCLSIRLKGYPSH